MLENREERKRNAAHAERIKERLHEEVLRSDLLNRVDNDNRVYLLSADCFGEKPRKDEPVH